MDFPDIFALISKSDNAPLILVFSIAVACIFLFREVIKLRRDVGQIASDKFTERKNAVLEVFKTLDELKKHDVQDFELKAIKEQFLKDLNLHISVERVAADDVNKNVQANLDKNEPKAPRTYIPSNIEVLTGRERLTQFIGMLFLFAFMTVWSAGWGVGMASFGLPAIFFQFSPLLHAISSLSLFEIIWRVLLLLFSVVIYFGIGIVPVALALCGVIGGILGMVTAIRPAIARNKTIRALDAKLLRWG